MFMKGLEAKQTRRVPTTMQTEAELKKLTVPQLKALCRDGRITGYSKLGKDAIIHKLLENAAANSGPPSLLPNPSVNSASSSKPCPKKQKSTPASLPTSSSNGDAVFKIPAVPNRALQGPLNSLPTTPGLTARAPKLNASVNPSLSRNISDSTPSSVTKTTAPLTAISVPHRADPARILASGLDPPNLQSATVQSQSASPIASTGPAQSGLKRPSAATSVPLPAKKQKIIPTILSSKSTVSKAAVAAIPFQENVKLIKKQPKPFVPLVVRATKSAALKLVSNVSVTGASFYLDFPPSPPPPSLPSIALPPSISQRKRVPRLSVILSLLQCYLANEDLRNCVLVSRMFRYAVYLSAYHRLVRNFAGQRLSMVLASCPEATRTTNMWPYLLQRMKELSMRKSQYDRCFRSGVFPTHAISEHLWTSPDHERQIAIALRFLLTRLFFQVSVGSGKGAKGWQEGQVVDAQQLVKDEVWMITVQHSATSTESFYVLEQTCEPLTATVDSPSTGLAVRQDWSAYIADRALSVHDSPPPPLLSYLSWTNHEEYSYGISRLWLKRIDSEGEMGKVKRRTAERYVFACVVGNSLSGRWMSSTQMAQEQMGLAEVVVPRVAASRKVNLFLPPHHHVESVHFTASGRRAGIPLHGALAVVQTPGREYFVLRDNGMQVGCEEEGVAEVWMKILGCDNLGVVE
ncbi:hypothetical protein GGX14DRAFT_519842 [Mycena pura]|uniref:Rho termination factor-like N-terminal domain-containing protein n=1 Tax=Mycena pura TaxID=153505 RepID=A0AAD6VGQ8_9AGAR|nr:hypothetical protein GGX14DRAFT_519842 [Mycena pura]